MTSVPEAYIAVAAMTLVGIGFPVGSFIAAELLRPRKSPNDPTKLRSWLLPGYESDQSLYIRRDSTYECGAEPLGEAHINFHFQYYWYAIIFLVFDVAFMFLVLGGMVTADATNKDGTTTIAEAESALLTLGLFFAIMSLGVWYVFRKRGRIYI